jgi:hypothetical protein
MERVPCSSSNDRSVSFGLGARELSRWAWQTLPALYSLPTTDFHDIRYGGNGGCTAGPGYDKVTGLGTPIANLLLPSKLVVTAPPSSVTAGSLFGLTVLVEDLSGSVDTSFHGSVTKVNGSNGLSLP